MLVVPKAFDWSTWVQYMLQILASPCWSGWDLNSLWLALVLHWLKVQYDLYVASATFSTQCWVRAAREWLPVSHPEECRVGQSLTGCFVFCWLSLRVWNHQPISLHQPIRRSFVFIYRMQSCLWIAECCSHWLCIVPAWSKWTKIDRKQRLALIFSTVLKLYWKIIKSQFCI